LKFSSGHSALLALPIYFFAKFVKSRFVSNDRFELGDIYISHTIIFLLGLFTSFFNIAFFFFAGIFLLAFFREYTSLERRASLTCAFLLMGCYVYLFTASFFGFL
jgi:hypothetical protein